MEPATEDQIAAIDHTHEHWSEFDIAYEGYRWHLLHAVVAEAHFDQAKAEALVTELEGGAKSYGYGREDSYRARMSRADVGTDEIESRSEEHTSELQSLMRISYAVFCLKKQKI